MPKPQVVRPDPVVVNLAPSAFQHYAEDFYDAYTKHQTGAHFSPARLFLLARSIELAAKALQLDRGKKSGDLRRMSHDLEKACEVTILAAYGITMTAAETAELKRANDYYHGKGFEYYYFRRAGSTTDSAAAYLMLKGWPDLPDEGVLEGLLTKLLSHRL